jgi:L-fuconate dehydratase
MTEIVRLDVRDIRFPTSRTLDGSDAMNLDPDYSCAYVVLTTSDPDWPQGHGLAFTIGRGTEIVVAAVEAMRNRVVGCSAEAIFEDVGGFWRSLVGDSQLRWIGPEKGAVHLGLAAIVNAVWDLWAKREGKPLWRLLADLPPERIVDAIDFRYIADALSPDEALAILGDRRPRRAQREAELVASGVPAYTTSVGWLGYGDDRIRRLCREARSAGWTRFKMKVGSDIGDDRRRAAIVREEIGPDAMLAMDANQRWGVDEAIAWVGQLAEFEPYWIEEPTSPDDILGHARIAAAVAPIRVANGEHVHNRIMFKQLFQADAISVCQIDACRLGGVNENLAVLLLAAKFGVPVCPHAGGVGLCELVQHLAIFDALAVSAGPDGRYVEYVDHLHEHFVDPVVVRDGAYIVPARPGYSAELLPASIERFSFPDGAEWRALTTEGVGSPA